MRTRHTAWPALVGLLLIQLWAAHAVVFFTHEYSHSFTAWLLGWKANPFALNYAHLTLPVVLLQLGINQNVNEAPIFASGHGFDAGLIAAAGAVVGNGLITLPLSRLGYHVALRRGYSGWALFAFWCTVASVGNFFDYVPLRTFTLESDMGSVQRGFGCSPWAVLLLLGAPTLLSMIWLFVCVLPRTTRQLFPTSLPKQAVIAVLEAVIMFGFYGAAGLLEGGPISHQLSTISVKYILPLSVLIALFSIFRRNSRRYCQRDLAPDAP